MALVILVVYIFLQNWRATLIPMIAVPVSLIGTFAFFPALGFSINTLSLFGLVLAIGLVVDDAIVVVEAVEHHIEEGMSPRDATLQAMREVSGPVVAIALILASVFIPMAFMSGIQGRLNKQFAVTVAISVIISAFNALTLSPALSAMLLRPRKPSRGPLGGFFRGFNWGFQKVQERLCGREPRPDSQGGGRHADSGLLCALDASGGQEASHQLSARRRLWFSVSERAASARRFAGTHRCGDAQDRSHPANTPGVQNYTTIDGFSLLTRVSTTNNCFLFLASSPGKKDAPPVSRPKPSSPISTGSSPTQVPEAVAFAFNPPRHPGPRQRRGLFVLAARPLRRLGRRPSIRTCRSFSKRRAGVRN